MPQLKGKKYAYTKKGKEQYEKDKYEKHNVGKKKKKYTLSSAKKKLASMGRRGDTELEHVNKDEQRMLRRMGSARSKNPRTGLTENFSIGSITRGIQSTYDQTVKKNLPKGLDKENVGQKMLGTLNATEEFVGGGVTNIGRGIVGTAAQILTGTNPYTQSSSSDESSTSSSNVSTRSGGFGAVKRKKKKKRGMAESDTEGQNTQGGKMSKRGLRTPKRTGLNIVKKNSSSTSLGM